MLVEEEALLAYARMHPKHKDRVAPAPDTRPLHPDASPLPVEAEASPLPSNGNWRPPLSGRIWRFIVDLFL